MGGVLHRHTVRSHEQLTSVSFDGFPSNYTLETRQMTIGNLYPGKGRLYLSKSGHSCLCVMWENALNRRNFLSPRKLGLNLNGHFHDEMCETSVRNGHVIMGSNGVLPVTYGHFTPLIVEISNSFSWMRRLRKR